MTKKTITILGSTGSIGTQSLSVCKSRKFQVNALTAHTNARMLEMQAREFLPRLVIIGDENQYLALKHSLADLSIQVAAGRDAICEAAADSRADIVLNAIVGIAGLRPTLAALEAGIPLALSNKESLIAGGSLVMKLSDVRNTPIYPVDSEHSAIWQCLLAGRSEDVKGVLLTASGGPFWGKSKDELAHVTIEQALSHPNWSMGAKISIDSATLMNKGLEFIEAMWLFQLHPEQIEVIIHRQSVVHSAVEFADGSVIAQMGTPDMRGAIQYALTHPARYPLESKRLSLTEYGSLTFEKPDLKTFQCLSACISAAKKGGLSPCIANGANEMAVDLFRNGKIPFLRIGELVAAAVEELSISGGSSLDSIESADIAARNFVLSRSF